MENRRICIQVSLFWFQAQAVLFWEVEGRGSGGKGVAYHTDSPTQVEDFDLGW